MKLTRYFQSCVLIEDGNTRVLIDPSGQESDNEFGKLDAVFYTHEHSDHFDANLADKLQSAGVAVYANASTARHLKNPATAVVENGQEIEVNQTRVQCIELPHCLMWDGSSGPQNTGYLFNGMVFHPGDGKEFDNLNVSNLLIPIAGPDISLKDSYSFVMQLGASKVIPIHYDYIGTKPEVFASHAANIGGFNVEILKIGESTEL